MTEVFDRSSKDIEEKLSADSVNSPGDDPEFTTVAAFRVTKDKVVDGETPADRRRKEIVKQLMPEGVKAEWLSKMSEKMLGTEKLDDYQMVEGIKLLREEFFEGGGKMLLDFKGEPAFMEFLGRFEWWQARGLVLDAKMGGPYREDGGRRREDAESRLDGVDEELTPDLMGDLTEIMSSGETRNQVGMVAEFNEQLRGNEELLNNLVDTLIGFQLKRMQEMEVDPKLMEAGIEHIKEVVENAKLAMKEKDGEALTILLAAIHDIEKYNGGDVYLAEHEVASAALAPVVLREALRAVRDDGGVEMNDQQINAVSKSAGKIILLHGKGEFPESRSMWDNGGLDGDGQVFELFKSSVYARQPGAAEAFGLSGLLAPLADEKNDMTSLVAAMRDASGGAINALEMDDEKKGYVRELQLMFKISNELGACDQVTGLSPTSAKKYNREDQKGKADLSSFYGRNSMAGCVDAAFSSSTAWAEGYAPESGGIRELLAEKLIEDRWALVALAKDVEQNMDDLSVVFDKYHASLDSVEGFDSGVRQTMKDNLEEAIKLLIDMEDKYRWGRAAFAGSLRESDDSALTKFAGDYYTRFEAVAGIEPMYPQPSPKETLVRAFVDRKAEESPNEMFVMAHSTSRDIIQFMARRRFTDNYEQLVDLMPEFQYAGGWRADIAEVRRNAAARFVDGLDSMQEGRLPGYEAIAPEYKTQRVKPGELALGWVRGVDDVEA